MRIDLASRAEESLLPYFEKIEGTLLREPKNSLRHRLRKDTAVTLHIAGKDPDRPNDLADVFGPTSSVLNRVLIYLLYRCGAISISRRPLDEAISSAQISADHVLCRHGCDTERHLKLIFNDYSHVEKAFVKMGSKQAQHPERYWKPGYFPVC